jgi:hypothetical protein
MRTVGVTDLYEAAFLLWNECRFAGVDVVPMAGVLGCSLKFEADDDLEYFQEQFKRREALVNLYEFRNAYNTVNGYVHQAKKSYEATRREDTRSASEAR